MREALLFVIAAACGGASPAVVAPEEYRAVHIDNLAPDKVAQFVDARRVWVAALDAAGASDGRGVFLLVDGREMLTVRRFTRFEDFDTRAAAIERSLAKVGKAAADAYDKGADESLVYPHASEIWQLDRDLSYAPSDGALDEASAGAGRIVLDDVKPDPADEERYGDAVAAEDAALVRAHYPLTRLGFRTVFGAGHTITLWLARSADERDRAPSVEAAVAGVVGAARAAELEAQIASSIEHREERRFDVRHDLTRVRAP